MMTVTFKLSDEVFAQLEQKAQQWKVSSVHKCARQIVIAYLQDAERNRVRQGITDLQKEVRSLREDFATAVAALLAKAGKVTHQEAHEWVERNFPLC